MPGTESQASANAILERLRAAINQHDLDELAACFEPDYIVRTENPPGKKEGVAPYHPVAPV